MERNGLRRRKRRIACHRWVMMSLESNSGAADARATVTWPSAEVSARLNPFRTALLCSRASTRESSNWVTASWHRVLQAERSWVSSPRWMPHCFRLTFRASLYRKTGPHCRRNTNTQTNRQTSINDIKIHWIGLISCYRFVCFNFCLHFYRMMLCGAWLRYCKSSVRLSVTFP